MFQVDPLSRIPIYEQLLEQMEKFILLGVISPKDKIPSVRSLSMELGVNPNTIQKVYAQLTARGVIYSVPGKGNFVAENAVMLLSDNKRKKIEEFSKITLELMIAGVSEEELLQEVTKVFNSQKQ